MGWTFIFISIINPISSGSFVFLHKTLCWSRSKDFVGLTLILNVILIQDYADQDLKIL